MWAYVLRRAALGLLTLFVISIISFMIIQLPPGDFVSTALAELAESGTETADEFAAQLRAEYGLDRPLVVQYGIWMGRVLQGNLGTSFFHQKPVLEVIGDRLPLSMLVSISALVFTLLIAIPIGIYSAVRQYSVGDHVATFLGFLGLATPNFLLALVMLYVGFLWLDVSLAGLFSAEYATAPWSLAKFGDLLVHLPIPAIVLGTAGAAQLIRITRANLLDEKRQPYVTTARAKGLSNRRAIAKYPVRVTMNPVGQLGRPAVPQHRLRRGDRVGGAEPSPPWVRSCSVRCSARTCTSPAQSSCCWVLSRCSECSCPTSP